jgi:Resolvase, N terminal domain
VKRLIAVTSVVLALFLPGNDFQNSGLRLRESELNSSSMLMLVGFFELPIASVGQHLDERIRIAVAHGFREPLVSQIRVVFEHAPGDDPGHVRPGHSAGVATESLPRLEALMANAHRRKFDAVIVWKFDRFAQSVSHFLRALETFNALGVAFVRITRHKHACGPHGLPGPGCRSRIGAQFDCGTRPGRPQKCASKGETAWPTAQDSRSYEDCSPESELCIGAAPGRSKIRETVFGTRGCNVDSR